MFLSSLFCLLPCLFIFIVVSIVSFEPVYNRPIISSYASKATIRLSGKGRFCQAFTKARMFKRSDLKIPK